MQLELANDIFEYCYFIFVLNNFNACMNKPKRHGSHVLSTTSKKFFEGKLPDEWLYNVPEHDYGIDYHIEIAEEEKVTGLNFSVQLKSTATNDDEQFSRIVLKSSTLGYLVTRLEPVMLVQYEKDSNEAYWGWLEDFSFDLSDISQKTFTLSLIKANKLSETNWQAVIRYVQQQFNNKSFIGDFDVFTSEGKLEKEAWKSYYRADFEQAVYLFRQVCKHGAGGNRYTWQALAWSLYQCYQYRESLELINNILAEFSNAYLQQTKACILAEYGKLSGDRGKLIQARDIFSKYLNDAADGLCYYNYANTLSSLGQDQQAMENFRISIAHNPNNAQCWKNLGTAYYNLGLHEEEIKCYDSALAINGNLLEALFSKGVTLAQVYGQYREALKYFDKVLAKANSFPPDFINGFYWIGFCYAELGEIRDAIKSLNVGLEMETSNPYLLRLKAQLLAKHWKEFPKRGEIISFFNFMWELQKDFSALANIIRVEGWSMDEALVFLKGKTPLYDSISAADLSGIGFGLEEMLRSVEYLSVYIKLRELYPPERYINTLISIEVVIGAKFWTLFDVLRCYAIGEGLEKIRAKVGAAEANIRIINVILSYLPALVDIILDGVVVEEENVASVFSQYYFAFDHIMYREIGVLTGHFTGTFGLEKFDAVAYLTEEVHEEFSAQVYGRLKRGLNLK
jgi:tetratricopeptide (TPR) repeat protein